MTCNKKNNLTIVIALMLAPNLSVWAELAVTEIEKSIDLPTVTVIGEKIARPLEETLSSVSVTTSADIQAHADANLHDIFARTPGVFATEGNNTFSIRGIPVDGLGAGSSDVISVYVDDALQSRRSVSFAPASMWDMEQVEIYRGSQSLIQGRNALAGSVILKSKDPTFETDAVAQINAGTFGERGGAVVVNGGLVPDRLAARLAVNYQDMDGYIENDFLGGKANPAHNMNARGKLLFRPNDDMDVLLTLFHNANRMGNESAAKVGSKAQFYNISTNVDAVDKVDEDAIIARIDYRFNGNWALTSISTVRRADFDSLIDFGQDVSVRDDSFNAFEQEDLHTQELRFTYSNGSTFQGLTGVYFNKTDRDRSSSLHTNVVDFEGNDALLALYADGFRIDFQRLGDTEITNAAAFGEINWEFVSDWQAILGLRFDREKNKTVDRRMLSTVTAFNGISPATDAAIQSGLAFYQGLFAATNPSINKGTFHAWLPKVGLRYTLADNQLLGFVVQRGYRAGGAFFNVVEFESVEFDPEYTNNYELTYRGAWLDEHLRLNANLYRVDWKDQQVRVLTNPADENSQQIENAGKSQLQGAEVALSYRPVPTLEIYSSLAFNDTEYKELITATQNFSGQAFERAPRWKVNAGSTVYLNNGLDLNLEAVYVGETTSVYLTDTNSTSPTYKQVNGKLRTNGYVLWSVSASYRMGDLRLSAYAKNLFDKEYVTNHQDGNVLDVGAPRTAGITVRYNF